MEIRKIEWENDNILGNLTLNFQKTNGQTYKTIIFAGENGSGKTTILKKIGNFLNCYEFGFSSIEYLSDSDKILEALPLNHPIKDFYRIKYDDGTIKNIKDNRDNNFSNIDNNLDDIRHSGCNYSKVRADFMTEKIFSATSKSLDESKYSLDEEDNFTSLKQLIVDIENLDYETYTNLNKSSNYTYDVFYEKFSKVARFKKAINNFLENVKYDALKTLKGEKQIIFTKNDNEILIDELSTGEKQIVFRGVYLLKNLKNVMGGTILIDEPELSMHPGWQDKILKYYRDLFTIEGEQKTQIFLATHSESVLKSALKNQSDILVIILKSEDGIVSANEIKAPIALPYISESEINYLAFNIISTDYHIQLYNWMMDKESLNSIKKADEFIKNNHYYNDSLHYKLTTYGGVSYLTLPTYVRNEIHHSPNTTFTDEQLRKSIELLINICK